MLKRKFGNYWYQNKIYTPIRIDFDMVMIKYRGNRFSK